MLLAGLYGKDDALAASMEEIILVTSTSQKTWVDQIPAPVRELLLEAVQHKLAAMEYSEKWAAEAGKSQADKFARLRAKTAVLSELERLLQGASSGA